MVTTTATLFEVSRFHEIVLLLGVDGTEPIITVQSEMGEWRANIRISDSAVIGGELQPLDQMSIQDWLSLHRVEAAMAWDRLGEGHTPEPIDGLPDNWPLGTSSPTRATSVKPLEGYRLQITWEDGSIGELDLTFLTDHPAFTAWQEKEVFEAVQIAGSCFTWGGNMEICAWLECWPETESRPG